MNRKELGPHRPKEGLSAEHVSPNARTKYPLSARVRVCPQSPGQLSVLNVEGVAKRLVKLDSGFEIELTDGFCINKRDGDRYQVVAADDAAIGKAHGLSDLDLGADTANRSGDRRAGDGGENGDGSITGQDTDGPPPRWWSQVGPEDVAAFYHSGAVSAASREAAETIAGSWGSLR